tara:strand:+ start:81 stop:374 length:294 start_codon:yes stop_codon:yes gene_type:complete
MNNPPAISSVVMPSSKHETDSILRTIKEITDSMTRIEGEKTFIKEATEDLSKHYNIPKPTLNKVIRILHKQNAAEERAKNEDTFYVLDTLINSKQGE